MKTVNVGIDKIIRGLGINRNRFPKDKRASKNTELLLNQSYDCAVGEQI